jgi:pyridoxal phosphate enzyme (YggS family)
MLDIKQNLLIINQEIEKTCNIFGFNANQVNLIAVAKTVDKSLIYQAIDNGCKVFGENYVQEAKEKWPEIKLKFPQIKLHLIGHLQSNKSDEALQLFDSIDSLDSEKLAIAIAKSVRKYQKNPQIFIQVNIGNEPQKSGIAINELEDFINFVKNDCKLNLAGLMAIPPENALENGDVSLYFGLLAKFAKKYHLKKLSMGMSNDFKQAIALGATHIRIGSAIFGKRK